MWFPVLFRFLAHSLTTFGRWGCGERCHLSHVVGDSVVVLSGMSRQIAPQTRSEALRHTKRGLNARQGMEGAKNAYRGSQEVRRADTLTRGFQVARNRVSPLQSLFARHRQLFGWLVVVDRRCYSDGVWGSPQTVSVALKALPEPWRRGRSGDREQKQARDFEAARAMQDRQSWSKR